MFQYNPLLCSFSLQFIFFAEQPFYGNIRHWILMQILLFLTRLPTRQDGVENRDKGVYLY